MAFKIIVYHIEDENAKQAWLVTRDQIQSVGAELAPESIVQVLLKSGASSLPTSSIRTNSKGSL